MRKLPLLLSILIVTPSAQALHATSSQSSTELQSSFLPSFSYKAGAVGLLRADITLLFGGDSFWLGPYVGFEEVSPSVTDLSAGMALRVGHDSYFELDGGYFQRTFAQTGTNTLSGQGFLASLIYGLHLSPRLGISVVLSAKRIASGDLDKRTIVDLLPLFTARVEF